MTDHASSPWLALQRCLAEAVECGLLRANCRSIKVGKHTTLPSRRRRRRRAACFRSDARLRPPSRRPGGVPGFSYTRGRTRAARVSPICRSRRCPCTPAKPGWWNGRKSPARPRAMRAPSAARTPSTHAHNLLSHTASHSLSLSEEDVVQRTAPVTEPLLSYEAAIRTFA